MKRKTKWKKKKGTFFYFNIPPSETRRPGGGGIRDGEVELKSPATVLCKEPFGFEDVGFGVCASFQINRESKTLGR